MLWPVHALSGMSPRCLRGEGGQSLPAADPSRRHPQEMVITDLQPETAYSITVAAYTMKGDGARSKPKVVVTKGAGTRLPTARLRPV